MNETTVGAVQPKTNKPYKMKQRPKKVLESVYSRCMISKKVTLPVYSVSQDVQKTIESNLKASYEGKCIVEGFVKPGTIRILTYSSGLIENGKDVTFEVVFECEVCFLVEGQLLSCKALNINKAGIRAVTANDNQEKSPVVVFISRDHHFNKKYFQSINEGDIFTAKVIGQRFELFDEYIGVIAQLVEENSFTQTKK
jgi:DNA-directed RNA polymerase subunit E'/Rpb7